MLTVRRALFGSGLVLLVVGAYTAGLTIPYYADDLMMYFPAADMHWAEHFVRTGPTTGFYRPLQNAILGLIQREVGMWPVPVHGVTLLLHLATVGLVYEGGRWLGLSRKAALLAAAVMGLAQANAAAVFGNDTLSQVGVTFFGYLALRLYGVHAWRGGSDTRRFFWLALGPLIGAVLFKEMGVAFALVLFAAEGLVGARAGRKGERATMYRSFGRAAVVLLVVGLYLTMRAWTGAMRPAFGPEPYQYHLGGNLIRNVVLFGAAATSVVPTTSVARWVQTGTLLPLGAALSASAVLVASVGYGLYRCNWHWWGGAMGVLAGMSLATVLPLNDVSELYVYAAMPAVSLIAGQGVVGILAHRPQWVQRVGGLLVGVYLLVQAGGVYHKGVLMKTTGDRTQALLDQMEPYVREAPQDGVFCLQGRVVRDTTAYSLFRMPGATPLYFSDVVLKHRADRPDLTVQVGRPACSVSPRPDSTVVLQLREDGWGVGPLGDEQNRDPSSR